MKVKQYTDINMPYFEIYLPNNMDIDKVYRIPSQNVIDREKLCYNRAKAIKQSLAEGHKVNWSLVIENVNEDIDVIQSLIEENLISDKQTLNQTTKIWEFIYTEFHKHMTANIIEISLFADKKEKSIDDMTAEELREYIKKHNIK